MLIASVDWLKVARLLLLSRAIDRLEVEQLTPQGKVKYQFSAGGHELSQILLAQLLDQPHDAAAVYYRSRPFMLASGLTPTEAFSAGMAHRSSPSRGRDVGVVYNLPKRSGATILPASGDVGAQYTPAAGWAQAIEYRRGFLNEREWDGAIAVAMGGEGSTAANGFWAALNIATTLKLPLLFFIEDNQFGLSVPSSFQTPGGNLAANLASFGNLRVMSGDGTNPPETWELVCQAVVHVRSGAGPCLLRLEVPRLSGHTFVDDQAYKSDAIRQEEAARDPQERLHAYLRSEGLSGGEWDRLVAVARQEAAEAAEAAEVDPDPEPGEATRFLFYEGIPPAQGGLRPEKALVECTSSDQPASTGPRQNFIDAVRRTLVTEMQHNPRMLIFGEDVGVKGGVHGATVDLQARFGPERVFDTSLSEDGILGRSVGMALAGLLPVPEIQFRKYADPAHEQISDLGTLRWRTANQFAAPVVVRIPVGFGKKTGDPWHSVTGEAVYAHTLGWQLAFPSNAADAAGLLRTALRGDNPTFFFEHRALLDTPEGRRPYPGDDYCLPFGKLATISTGDELTVISWGALVPRCVEAARDFPGRVAVLDLRTVIPWDQEGVLESIRRTGKALVVHEDTYTAGFAGEILATIAEQAFTDLDAPVARLAAPDVPVPFNTHLMEQIIPGVERIRAKIKALLEY